MIRLFEQDIQTTHTQSSKGNQLKWSKDNIWYKGDYAGYEGLAEHTISRLMSYSTLEEREFVSYETEEILYGKMTYLGCRSEDFLPEKWQLITLERLFHSFSGESLYKSLYQIEDNRRRVEFMVDTVSRITEITDFGVYMSKLLTVDAMFLNEDRHMHNIGVLIDEKGKYHVCPIFDNGAALLSDTQMDYPMGTELEELLAKAESKTFFRDFDTQLDIVEQLYGQHIKFNFTAQDVSKILDEEKYYPREVKARVFQIITEQRRKYKYLF